MVPNEIFAVSIDGLSRHNDPMCMYTPREIVNVRFVSIMSSIARFLS